MQLRQLKIEISEDLLESLKKASEDQNISEEKLAEEILAKALKHEEEPKKPTMPGVALIKNDFVPEPPSQNLMQKQVSGLNMPTTSPASAEKIRRKQELEARMKEVSLLIETAENLSKKEEYVELYAQLAAELDALL